LSAHYLFAWGSLEPTDPNRHAAELKRSSGKLRARISLSCRFHDLRHRADSPIMPTSPTGPL